MMLNNSFFKILMKYYHWALLRRENRKEEYLQNYVKNFRWKECHKDNSLNTLGKSFEVHSIDILVYLQVVQNGIFSSTRKQIGTLQNVFNILVKAAFNVADKLLF